jgi:hypothetical protein
MMQTIGTDAVFDAVRRGYADLADATDDEILDYFGAQDAEALTGHLANVKGILFEREYAESLRGDGVDARLYEATNHPESDIALYEDGAVVQELQLKATDDPGYVRETMASLPDDVTVVTTSEVAEELGDEVVDSGISDALLEEAVADTLVPVSPISVLGWLFGIF